LAIQKPLNIPNRDHKTQDPSTTQKRKERRSNKDEENLLNELDKD